MITWDTEIRKLQLEDFVELCRILNHDDVWKNLMAVIRVDDDEEQLMFSSDHVAMVEQAMKQQQKGGADIFLLEYGTMGRKRPTCRTLYQHLVKAKLTRAADYLSINILKVGPAERPKTGPAARIDTSEETLRQLIKKNLDDAFLKAIHELPTTVDHWSPQPPKTQIKSSNNEKPVKDLVRNDLIDFSKTQPDLIEFSIDRSDMIKFSIAENAEVSNKDENTPEGAAQVEETASRAEEQNYGLQELRSEDIPLCVRQDILKLNEAVSLSSQEYESTTSVETSDCSQTITTDESIVMPATTQHNIPIVVLEYNEKKDKAAI